MRPDTARRHTDRVQLVLPYIASRLASPTDPLNLDQLARVANTAPFYFHRIFRSFTGEPLYRYIRRLRLEFAAYRLLFSRQPIIQVAIDAGYESHAAFTRAFKKHFGAPPTTFREFLDGSLRCPDCVDNALLGITGPTMPTSRRSSNITIKSTARRKVAFLRHFGAYANVQATWERLHAWVERTRPCPESIEAIGIVYDSPEYCLGADIRYDACIVVPSDLMLDNDIGTQFIPAYNAIVARHCGLRELIVCTYVRLILQWVVSGVTEEFHRLPYYEVYSHFPFTDSTPEVDAEVHVSLV